MRNATSLVAVSLSVLLTACDGGLCSNVASMNETKATSPESGESLMTTLRPQVFGDKQPMLDGIRAGVGFESASM